MGNCFSAWKIILHISAFIALEAPSGQDTEGGRTVGRIAGSVRGHLEVHQKNRKLLSMYACLSGKFTLQETIMLFFPQCSEQNGELEEGIPLTDEYTIIRALCAQNSEV